MAAIKKQSVLLARQLFKLSLLNGALSAEHVAAALAYVEKHKPADVLGVLKAYQRLVAAEFARGQAIVEHAGSLSEGALRSLEGAFSQKYRRPITATARANASLIAGLRVRIADDVYESSVAGQLATLADAV